MILYNERKSYNKLMSTFFDLSLYGFYEKSITILLYLVGY